MAAATRYFLHGPPFVSSSSFMTQTERTDASISSNPSSGSTHRWPLLKRTSVRSERSPRICAASAALGWGRRVRHGRMRWALKPGSLPAAGRLGCLRRLWRPLRISAADSTLC